MKYRKLHQKILEINELIEFAKENGLENELPALYARKASYIQKLERLK